MNNSEAPCPLAEVDQRLSDTHRLWHRANDSYFDPEEFRINLNNLIQTSRTVTFILQKHKDKIPHFAEWYAPHQAEMKADVTMRWLVDARNEIEKEGDLVTKSIVRAQIVASHLNEFPAVQVEAHLFDDVRKLFEQIPSHVLKAQVLKHGFLQVERTWIHEKLPHVELLEALAHAYGFMAKIVADAHRQMGLAEPTIIGIEDCAETNNVDGRLPCMNWPGEIRTLRVHLADGSRLSVAKKSVKWDRAQAEARIQERYGGMPASTDQGDTSFEKTCYYFFGLARKLMETDYYHDPMIFLIKGSEEFHPIVTPARDRQDKYMLSRMIADEVKAMGADAVISIGEIWHVAVPQEEFDPFQYPADRKDRREAIMLTGATKDGEKICLKAEVTRERSRVRRMLKKPEKAIVGPTVLERNFSPFLLGPVFEVWGLPMPTRGGAFDTSDSD